MNWIKNMFIKYKQTKATKELNKSGLEYKRTKLGQAAFIPLNTKSSFANKIIFPDEWSKAEFKAIHQYMKAYPDCTMFDDGSGRPCK